MMRLYTEQAAFVFTYLLDSIASLELFQRD